MNIKNTIINTILGLSLTMGSLLAENKITIDPGNIDQIKKLGFTLKHQKHEDDTFSIFAYIDKKKYPDSFFHTYLNFRDPKDKRVVSVEANSGRAMTSLAQNSFIIIEQWVKLRRKGIGGSELQTVYRISINDLVKVEKLSHEYSQTKLRIEMDAKDAERAEAQARALREEALKKSRGGNAN